MKIIVKNHMFFVLNDKGTEIACFKSFRMLAEYVAVVSHVKGIMVLNTVEEV